MFFETIKYFVVRLGKVMEYSGWKPRRVNLKPRNS